MWQRAGTHYRRPCGTKQGHEAPSAQFARCCARSNLPGRNKFGIFASSCCSTAERCLLGLLNVLLHRRAVVCLPLPSRLYIQNDLPAVRRELQKDLRSFIKKVGPELGEIYTKPDLKWGDLFRMQKVGGMRLTAEWLPQLHHGNTACSNVRAAEAKILGKRSALNLSWSLRAVG